MCFLKSELSSSLIDGTSRGARQEKAASPTVSLSISGLVRGPMFCNLRARAGVR